MDRLEHLLVILSEECVELAKECSKALRFGLDGCEPGTTITNRTKIINEFNDLYAMIQMLSEDGVFNNSVILDINKIRTKQQKVEKYLKYSEGVGTLEPNKKYYIGVDLANGKDIQTNSLCKKVGENFEYFDINKPNVFKKCYGSNCPFRDICTNYVEEPVGWISYVDYQYVEGYGCEHFKEVEK